MRFMDNNGKPCILGIPALVSMRTIAPGEQVMCGRSENMTIFDNLTVNTYFLLTSMDNDEFTVAAYLRLRRFLLL
jgi:hypothetical protein